MNPRITAVKPEKGYRLVLSFTNGETRIFDMKPYLNIGLFEQLKNEAMFTSVRCALGTVQWQNGLDLCPDTLYEDSLPA